MALKKDYETGSGAVVQYWKIHNLTLPTYIPGALNVKVELVAYVSQDMRNADKSPMDAKQIDIPLSQFENELVSRALVYAKIKEVDAFFADAEDV